MIFVVDPFGKFDETCDIVVNPRLRGLVDQPFSLDPCRRRVDRRYPLGKFGPVTRKPLEQVVSPERWGNSLPVA